MDREQRLRKVAAGRDVVSVDHRRRAGCHDHACRPRPAAPPPGFEPGPSEPKSEVLPLHHGGLACHGPMCVGPALLRHGRLVCRVTTPDENDGHFARRRDAG